MVDVIAPVTDYVSDSILTTRGDLLKRGVTDAERFGIGSALQALRVNAGGTDLEYVNPGIHLFDTELSAANGALVTLGAGFTTIISLSLGSVVVNDRYSVQGHVVSLKDATAANVNTFVGREEGIARIEFLHNNAAPNFNQYVNASKFWVVNFNFTMKVITGGDLVLRIAGSSAVGAATIAIGSGSLYIHSLRT